MLAPFGLYLLISCLLMFGASCSTYVLSTYTGQDEEGEVMCVSLPPPPPSNISWDQYINSPDEEYAAHSLTANTDTLCNFVVSWVLWSIRIVYCMQYFVWTQLVACSGHAVHVYVQRVCLLHATCCVCPSHWSWLLSHNLACSARMLPLLHFSINVHTGIDLFTGPLN